MKSIKLFAVPVFVVALLIAFAVFSANGDGLYTQLPTIPIPGNLARGFDISWADPVSGRYYLADRTTGSVDVIDAEQSTYLYSIKGFVGVGPSGKAGPDGILTLGNELWAGDGDSTVKVVDLTKGAAAVPFIINTGGKFRADELAYDPQDHVILIANDRDDPPFVTFISQTTRTILAQIPYPQAAGFGLEQPVWDSISRRFYLAIPGTTGHPDGEVDELDPVAFKVTRVFPTQCSGPSGLALLPGERLVTACGSVLDAKSGGPIANIYNFNGTPVSGDEIWYNSGDDRIYFGSNNVAVVDASTYQLIRMSGTAIFQGLRSATLDSSTYQVLTYLFPSPFPAPGGTPLFGGHTLAANSANNHIFVAVTGAGVKVFVKN